MLLRIVERGVFTVKGRSVTRVAVFFRTGINFLLSSDRKKSFLTDFLLKGYNMKPAVHKLFAIVLCLSLFLAALPSVFAESGEAYDSSVITGFDTDYSKTIDTEYKYALIELKKEFPARLMVHFGGEITYQAGENGSLVISGVSGYTQQDINVEWKCLEGYDTKTDVFHFIPDLAGYGLAAGLDLPVITVNVLGEFQAPPTYPIPDAPDSPDLPSGEVLASKNMVLPESYNGYALGKLPPVRDQGAYGICWTFATMACVEGDLIHDNNAEPDKIDLSELHLAYYTFHDFYDEKGCNAGDTATVSSSANYREFPINSYLAGFPLANMLGPVPEKDVPYSLIDGYEPGPNGGRTGSVQVTGVYRNNNANKPEGRDVLKAAIMEHGAVSVNYYEDVNYENKNYSAEHNSYYQPEDPHGTNHAVAIVGWNDNFPSENFINGTPEGNGAWLLRNSWGKNGYGHAGYFWLSYYDKGLGPMAVWFDAQPWRYDHVYAYDNTINYTYTDGYSSDTTISQVFHIDGFEVISAISYYLIQPRMSGVEFTVTSGDQTATTGPVSFGETGFYLIPLESPLIITNNSDVTVEIHRDFSGFYPSLEPLSISFGDSGRTDVVYSSSVGSSLLIDGEPIGYDPKIKLFTKNFDLVLPAELTIIESEAFLNDSSFKSVKLQDKATTIGSKAFANCSNLTVIYIPRSTTSIAPDAFGGRTDITIIGYSGSDAETFATTYGLPFKPIS